MTGFTRSQTRGTGAILYEMLTLQPPVEKEGGYMAILTRVIQGQIIPPEERDPKRTRAGKIPKELAAIAMKALAREPGQRYPNVEALRKDIERFQEGRSVSAKEDTGMEMIWKFAKRNKGFSAGLAAALLVLLGSLWVIGKAYLRAQRVESWRSYAATHARTIVAICWH